MGFLCFLLVCVFIGAVVYFVNHKKKADDIVNKIEQEIKPAVKPAAPAQPTDQPKQ